MKPIQEDVLDKMIDVLEGPANKLAERVLRSKIVLAPLSLSMNLWLRGVAKVMGNKNDR